MHPNETLVRRGLAAMKAQDMDVITGLLADDVRWYEVGARDPIVGKDDLFKSFAGADFTIVATLEDVLVSDGRAAALYSSVAQRNGSSLTYNVVEVYVIEDGKVTERRAYSDDEAAVVAFFA